MKNTKADYLISFNYIMEHMRENRLDLSKTVKTLGTVELDKHHQEDLQFSNEQELLIDAADCLEHLLDVQKERFKSTYPKEMKRIEELIETNI